MIEFSFGSWTSGAFGRAASLLQRISQCGITGAAIQSFASFDSLYDDKRSYPSPLLPRLRIAEDVHRNQRWEWLNARTVVVVQNLRREEFDGLYEDQDVVLQDLRLKEIGVTAEHILPNKTPREWAKTLRMLYGRAIEAADATITVFIANWRDPIRVQSETCATSLTVQALRAMTCAANLCRMLPCPHAPLNFHHPTRTTTMRFGFSIGPRASDWGEETPPNVRKVLSRLLICANTDFAFSAWLIFFVSSP